MNRREQTLGQREFENLLRAGLAPLRFEPSQDFAQKLTVLAEAGAFAATSAAAGKAATATALGKGQLAAFLASLGKLGLVLALGLAAFAVLDDDEAEPTDSSAERAAQPRPEPPSKPDEPPRPAMTWAPGSIELPDIAGHRPDDSPTESTPDLIEGHESTLAKLERPSADGPPLRPLALSALPQDQQREYIETRKRWETGLRLCYDEALLSHGSVAPPFSVLVVLRIREDGTVSRVGFPEGLPGGRAFELCLRSKLSRWKFPRSKREVVYRSRITFHTDGTGEARGSNHLIPR